MRVPGMRNDLTPTLHEGMRASIQPARIDWWGVLVLQSARVMSSSWRSRIDVVGIVSIVSKLKTTFGLPSSRLLNHKFHLRILEVQDNKIDGIHL